MRVLLISLVLLAACQSPASRDGARTVTVRMGAGSEALAERACGGGRVEPESVHQGTNTIIYRCLGEGS